MKLVAHTLIKNEQRWIWYSLTSVLDFVDEIMVWDTGSTDQTVQVVKSISSPKIKFMEIGSVDPQTHSQARNEMIQKTSGDWILVLDGDEIWWGSSLAECIRTIEKNPSIYGLISPFINLVGDLHHYQSSDRSQYKIGQYKGPYNLRFINRRIPGLHLGNPHGRQEYRDENELSLQKQASDRLIYVDAPYLHTTHLSRSVDRTGDRQTLKRGFKYRYEIGRRFSRKFIYPQALYCPAPAAVPDPFFHRSASYVLKSALVEPARLIKSYLTSSSSGY